MTTRFFIGRKSCETEGCENIAAINKQGYVLRYCWKCKSKQLKQRHPATYVLNGVRAGARNRGLPCTITLAEFKEFCKQTGYLERRGRNPDSLSLDRIDHSKGYHLWNLCVRPYGENCQNGHTIPGVETKQNERRPESYNYDYHNPEPAAELAEVAENPF